MRTARFNIILCSALIISGVVSSGIAFAQDDAGITPHVTVPATLTGAWATSIDGKEAQLALWPKPGAPEEFYGYLYIANHDCLMAAHIFAFDDEIAFGFTARGMNNRTANCDRNLMVAVPVYEGDGTLQAGPSPDTFGVRLSEIMIGTSLIPADSDESVDLTFQRVRPTDEFLDILASYRHRFRPGPESSFLTEIRNRVVPPRRFAATPADFSVTSSGLKYKILSTGSGRYPTAADTVTVHYRGTLTDGSEFDSSYSRGEPTSFPLNGVIAGWTEGLQLIQPGGKIKLIIPPDLAYGTQGFGPIQPNATLIFEIELLTIK